MVLHLFYLQRHSIVVWLLAFLLNEKLEVTGMNMNVPNGDIFFTNIR